MKLSRIRLGGGLLCVCAVVLVAACGGGSSTSSGALATSQALRFPVLENPGTWDPAEANVETDTEVIQNVFDNLWRFDDNLNIVPDIAGDVPTVGNGGISADGLTYTIHLKHNVTFNNGDAVTAKDVVYSWDRAVDYQGPYASNLSAIAGYSAAQSAAGTPPTGGGTTSFFQNIENHLANNDAAYLLSGLSAQDPYTLQIKLANSCGWCLTAWTLEGTSGAIVDQRVIKNDPAGWYFKPGGAGSTDGLVGTGAYYLSSFTPKQGMVFKRVSNWWGSPTPTLTEVDIDIKDPAALATNVTAWEQGSYDIVGYGGDSGDLTYPLVQGVKTNPAYASGLLTQPKGRTTWISFNEGYTSTPGPFLGESAQAKGLREAFDLAIDKQGFASTVCHDVLCSAATGGLITTGLIGGLGDDKDPAAKYDPAMAKSLLKKYDPTGALTSNLTYSYDVKGLYGETGPYLQSQWQQNLGVHVTLNPVSDHSQFVSNRLSGKYTMSRDGWQFDYNHPQDWYDNLWGASSTQLGENTSGFDDPTYDSLLTQADQEDISQALSKYDQLAQILASDWLYIPLYYQTGNFLIHTYVKGAGSNTAFDHYWNEISIQQH